jgi:PAS domain S-box-containing protein
MSKNLQHTKWQRYFLHTDYDQYEYCTAGCGQNPAVEVGWHRRRNFITWFFGYIFLLLILLFLTSACAAHPAFDPRGISSIKVVMDNNYPPFTFLDQNGNPQGILIDQWRLWEQKTGIQVEITTLEWGEALRRMQAGESDVIDTIFYNPERAKLYDFSRPYTDIEVPVYFRNNISGIEDPETLRGFTVAVKTGDNAINFLRQNGIDQLIEYPSYEAIIQAAKNHDVLLFMIDKPPAEYFLAKYDLQNQFNASPPFYTGQFHRAVKKGNTALLSVIEQGFSLISPSEYKYIDRHWYGVPPISPSLTRALWISSLSIAVFILGLVLWNRSLQTKVKQRTAELNALFAAMPDAVLVFDQNGRYLDIPTPDSPFLIRPPRQMIGKNLHDLLPESTAEIHLQAIRRAIQEKRTVLIEYPLTIAGEEIWFSAGLAPLDDKRVVLVARDLSDRKKKEEILQKSEAELRHFNRLLRTLSECNQALVRAQNENELLQTMCSILVAHGGYPLVWIGYLENNPPRLYPVASAGANTSVVSVLHKSLEELLSGKNLSFPEFCATQQAMAYSVEDQSLLSPADLSALAPHIKSLAAIPLRVDAETSGCLLIYSELSRPALEQEIDFLKELAGDIAFGVRALRQQAQQKRTETMLAQANLSLAMAYEATIEGWARALEYHEQETAGHSRRVVELMLRFARRLGFREDQLLPLRYGALLHDIGKMVISSDILNKPGKLDDDEWEIMRRHPQIAYDLLKDIDYLMPSLDIPYSHHEWWDGSGYPHGLSGEEIPLTARMFALVDVYDALTSDRPYRPAFSKQEAMEMIRSLAGKQFDPTLTEVFLDLVRKLEEPPP